MARPRKFKEEDVVAAASAVFASKGYAGTTMDDLAAATGLGKQSIYNSFGGKLELFIRAFQADGADAVAIAEAALDDSEGTPLQKIHAHVIMTAVTASTKAGTSSLFTKGTSELSASLSEVAGAALKVYSDLETVYRGCLVDAQEYGEIDPASDAEALATFFVSFLRGIEALGSAGVSRDRLLAAALTAINSLPLTEHGQSVVASDSMAPEATMPV
ncbi:TetR/AcrR family transcriptional regulator [Cryobacterium lactosi]|uniref:TetR/AcrR family transcriptional regulator n=1 Tax=Cryobacterium lactosi TaxID=1259202 RepID=A0A4R9BYH1_9MICO|nr:TetR/AcrR family transcriptional regulator [Cryobacterium lactosi]TFD92092.1 TetR/AcrR family transcriptional regulator [Cryobacterium lactosi]